MGWILEGFYQGSEPALGAQIELRFDRGGTGQNVAQVSGDVYLPDGVVCSFVGENGKLSTDAAGVVRGGARVYSTDPNESPSSTELVIEPGADEGSIMLRAALDAGELNTSLTLDKGAPFRSIKLKIDRLARAPKPPDDIFEDVGASTLRSCLASAGIAADFDAVEVIPEADDVQSLRASELHAIMQKHGDPPQLSRQWWLHVMLARRFIWENSADVSGALYDVYGEKDTPDRQGCAVFMQSDALSRLEAEASRLETEGKRLEAEAARAQWRKEILFTLVHEIGHGLNLPHSFERGGNMSATWMNYPDEFKVDAGGAGGAAAFWGTFDERFDPMELSYLRHAPCCDIAPGRRPYALRLSDLISGGKPGSAPRFAAIACDDGEEPKAEFTVTPLKTAPARYAYGEPIFLKVAIKNVGKSKFDVPRALDPTDGLLRITIIGPNGAGRLYRPPLALCQKFHVVTLKPGKSIEFDGVFVGFDALGPLFDQPGKYRIEATFSGLPGAPLRSRSAELRVFYPTRTEEALAVTLWDDRKLMNAVYYRQPLLAREAWGALLDAHEKAAKAKQARPGDTTFDYLKFVGAMGYSERFRPGASKGWAKKPAQCVAKLKDVTPKELPSGVKTRVKIAERGGDPTAPRGQAKKAAPARER